MLDRRVKSECLVIVHTWSAHDVSARKLDVTVALGPSQAPWKYIIIEGLRDLSWLLSQFPRSLGGRDQNPCITSQAPFDSSVEKNGPYSPIDNPLKGITTCISFLNWSEISTYPSIPILLDDVASADF